MREERPGRQHKSTGQTQHRLQDVVAFSSSTDDDDDGTSSSSAILFLPTTKRRGRTATGSWRSQAVGWFYHSPPSSSGTAGTGTGTCMIPEQNETNTAANEKNELVDQQHAAEQTRSRCRCRIIQRQQYSSGSSTSSDDNNETDSTTSHQYDDEYYLARAAQQPAQNYQPDGTRRIRTTMLAGPRTRITPPPQCRIATSAVNGEKKALGKSERRQSRSTCSRTTIATTRRVLEASSSILVLRMAMRNHRRKQQQ